MINNLSNSPIEPPQAVPRGVPRWPALLALLAVGLLFMAISPDRTLGLGWLVLPAMIIMLFLIRGAHWRGNYRLNQLLARSAAAITTLALIISVSLLVASIPAHKTGPVALLGDAILLWITNVLVFGLWYWMIDGGGPQHRRSDTHETTDFLFPQTVAGSKDWVPGFIDYVFLAFNTSTAFSPTDTAVMSRRAKLLMMLQASISLIILAVLAARAINTF